MVKLGQLVREDCSSEKHARMGTIVKVTDLALHTDDSWEKDYKRWKEVGSGYECSIIRPGKVVSVRWQNDVNKVTLHVFYGDDKQAQINMGTNEVQVVESES